MRMENVGIVVEDLDATVAFFLELGLEEEGRMIVDGQWAARISGFDEIDLDVAMLRTPDGESRLELMSFRTPKAVGHQPDAPANTHGIRRILFSVPDVEDVLARLRNHGAELVGELTRIDDSFLMCYVRGPEGIIVALAEKLG
ncbi:VOC family protein [Amycolatopsis iheyensis]|nr:VOC family protein [Amycolatopsis iheyensis]